MEVEIIQNCTDTAMISLASYSTEFRGLGPWFIPHVIELALSSLGNEISHRCKMLTIKRIWFKTDTGLNPHTLSAPAPGDLSRC